jgi:hypothetical protein
MLRKICSQQQFIKYRQLASNGYTFQPHGQKPDHALSNWPAKIGEHLRETFPQLARGVPGPV